MGSPISVLLQSGMQINQNMGYNKNSGQNSKEKKLCKRKSILVDDKMGEVTQLQLQKKNKKVLLRAAAAAISLSASSEGILHRNQIILDEAEAMWEVGKLLGFRTG